MRAWVMCVRAMHTRTHIMRMLACTHVRACARCVARGECKEGEVESVKHIYFTFSMQVMLQGERWSYNSSLTITCLQTLPVPWVCMCKHVMQACVQVCERCACGCERCVHAHHPHTCTLACTHAYACSRVHARGEVCCEGRVRRSCSTRVL